MAKGPQRISIYVMIDGMIMVWWWVDDTIYYDITDPCATAPPIFIMMPMARLKWVRYTDSVFGNPMYDSLDQSYTVIPLLNLRSTTVIVRYSCGNIGYRMNMHAQWYYYQSDFSFIRYSEKGRASLMGFVAGRILAMCGYGAVLLGIGL